ncbi:uncharacterized protein LOC123537994 [Mercenaria mercenaria]|uniref:uncharacterized protein LOC123537994 n=1 Tax=Mercenaria mercenaria TaxID=6596 RepID=UPI00234EC7E5|nr:uncharacterized protein LOC123537994 [Mercenaria mercenaria]
MRKTSRKERRQMNVNTLQGLHACCIRAKDKIAELNNTAVTNKKSADGTTYIRWGRTVCPKTAFLVYDGYAAGSYYSQKGSGINTLCLPKDPNYDQYTDGLQPSGRIYGAEYETHARNTWSHLKDLEVPCAVCRIPSNNVLMVPGKNECHVNYLLEYKGYLMSGYYSPKGPSEYVCVDDQPEGIKKADGNQDHNGKLFYFVEGSCGALKCPPYTGGWELTCAICSFSPKV